MNQLKPTGTRVLVQPIYAAQRVGRIHVPTAFAEDRPQEATIVALGPRAKLDAKVGDRVVTDAFAGTWMEIRGKRHRMIQPGDVLAVVEQL